MSLGKLRKREFNITSELLADLARIFDANPGEGTPRVIGYYDRAGALRRIVATYPNGWTVTGNVNARGYVTSTRFRCTFKAMVREINAQG